MSDPSDRKSSMPVPVGPLVEHTEGRAKERIRPRKPRGEAAPDEANFAAQVLSGGEKRGLKGGPETLERAKSTYLKSEYSGPNDRRPQPGRVTRTKI